MKVYITTPMTLCIEGETMTEIAVKYLAAVPECCISDYPFLLAAGSNQYDSDLTTEFNDAYEEVVNA